jgi:hypothetical protein
MTGLYFFYSVHGSIRKHKKKSCAGKKGSRKNLLSLKIDELDFVGLIF